MTIYRSALISRKSSLHQTDFENHWIHEHGKLASQLPDLLNYRQNHILERIYESVPFPLQHVDGISQLAFTNIKAMEQSEASEAYIRTKADIAKFQGEITILILKAFNLIPRDINGSFEKLILISSRKNTHNCHPTDEWWHSTKNKLKGFSGLKGFTKNQVIDRDHPVVAGIPSGNAEAADIITELWFDSEQSVRHTLSSQSFSQFSFQDPWLSTIAIYRIQELKIY